MPGQPLRRVLRASDRLLPWAFVALLAFAPLPYGGNSRFGWTLIALAVGVLLLLESFRAALWHKSRTRAVPAPLLTALGLLGLAVLWIVVQTLPYTPQSWHHPLWLDAGAALGAVRGSISLNADESWTGLMRLLSYVGAFWLALGHARAPGGASRIVTALVVIGGAYAIFGLLAFFFLPDKILWFDKWYGMAGVHSTFINRNSYATYAGMGLLAAAGLLITHARRRFPRRQPVLAASLGVWLIPAIVVLASALVLTASRAGTMSTAVGLAALIGSLGMTRLIGGRLATAWVLGFLILGGLIFALVGDDLAERLAGTDLEDEGRFPMYGRILVGIADFALRGTGYATFGEAFRPYVGQISELWWDQAHNTYLELAFELGLPATLALLMAVLVPVVVCARGLAKRRRSALYPSLALSASALVAAHALLDFSIEIPGIAITFATILGVGCARSLPSVEPRRRSRRQSLARRWAAPGFAGALAGGILLLATPRLVALVESLPALLLQGPLEAGVVPRIGEMDRAIDAARRAGTIAHAAHFAWLEGRVAFAQAQRSGLPANLRQVWFERASRPLQQSLARAPANPAAWSLLAYCAAATRPDAPLVVDAARLSVLTGPNFLPQVPVRALVAAVAWERFDRQTRALYRSQFVYGMRHRPWELVRALASLPDVTMVYESLEDHPKLAREFDRMRRVIGTGRTAMQ
jgi:O-antigen ligase